MEPLLIELTTEQHFSLRSYQIQMEGMSEEQAKDLLLQVLRQLMIKENIIKQLLRAGH